MINELVVGISLVSHNNADDIYDNHAEWNNISTDFLKIFVCVTDNIGDKQLEEWCRSKKYLYSSNLSRRGFGANNNHNFELLNSTCRLDYFLVINPDVKLNVDSFLEQIANIDTDKFDIMGARVTEEKLNQYVSQRRRFPALCDPVISLVLKRKLFLLDPKISGLTDWVGGSFMLIKSSAYFELKGFDESFFMYYEDIDLCKRAKSLGLLVYYNANIEYFHYARRQGHEIGSRHFFWNLKSMLKYFMRYPTLRLLSYGGRK